MKLILVKQVSSVGMILALNCVLTFSVRSNIDFDDGNKPSLIERTFTEQRKQTPPKKNQETSKIGIICGPNGCNTTTSGDNKVTDGDTISADVAVQVKINSDSKTTSSDNSKPSSETKQTGNGDEDVPDIPVVVGHGGGRAITPQEHIIPPDRSESNYNRFHHNPNAFYHYNNEYHPRNHVKNGGNSFIPSSWGVSVEFKPQGHYPNDYKTYNYGNSHGNSNRGNAFGLGFGRPAYYNLTPWYRRIDSRVTPQPLPAATTCVCQPHINSVWPASTPPTNVNFNNPGKQINDKLAPLL